MRITCHPRRTLSGRIRIEITYQRKREYISLVTDAVVKDAEWNPKPTRSNWVRPSHPLSNLLNEEIKLLTDRISEAGLTLLKVGKPFAVKDVKTEVLKSIAAVSITDWLKQWPGQGTSYTERAKRSAVVKNLLEFTPTFNTGHLSNTWLRKFADHLLKDNKPNTVRGKVERLLRGLRESPFAEAAQGLAIKIEGGYEYEPQDRLNAAEVAAIESVVCKPGSVRWYAQQLFRLSVYTGMRPGDILRLTRDKIRTVEVFDDSAGKTMNLPVLLTKATKTKKAARYVPLLPVVIDILHELDRLNPKGMYFPKMDGRDLSKENKVVTDPVLADFRPEIKKIALEAGITKTVNIYTARHTGGEAVYTATGNIRSAQGLLDHASFATTEKHYLDLKKLAQLNQDLVKTWGKP